jgi:hypothetical protein
LINGPDEVAGAGVALSTVAGAGVIGLALVDVFVTLFWHAEHRGLSHVLIRAVWVVCHRLRRRRALTIAGPVAFLVVVASWATMLSLGWALVYWPRMPGGFAYATAPADGAASFFESLYFSLVTLATLGYGPGLLGVSPAANWGDLQTGKRRMASL